MGNMSGSYGSHYTIWINIKTNSQSVANNQTNITTELYLSFDGSTYYATQYNATPGNMVILWDGQEKVNQSYTIPQIVFASGQKKDILLASWTGNVPHDSQGKRKITVSGSWDTQTSRIGSGVSTITDYELKQINRYPSFTTNPYLTSRGLDSLTFSYGAVNMASSIYYSLDNLNWKAIYSQNTTISGLNPNTTYTIYVQARNQQATSLYTTKSFQATTLDIARITNAPNIQVGQNPTITFTNPSGSKITLYAVAKVGDQSIAISDKVDVTGKSSYTLPLNTNTIYQTFTTTNTANIRYAITTSNDNNIHWVDRTGTIVNSNPTFSNFVYTDVNNIITQRTGNPQILVKGFSTVQVNIPSEYKAVGKNSAQIKSYKASIGNKTVTFNYSNNAVTSPSISPVSTNVIDVHAIDSRGNSTKVSKTLSSANYKEYFALKINSLTAARENGIGEKVTLNFKITFWNNSFGSVTNKITLMNYKYKTTSSSSYTTGKTALTYTTSGNTATGTIVLDETFDINDTYNIQLYATDELTNDTSTITINAGNPALAIYKNRVAIGDKYDESLDIPLQVKKRQNIRSGVSDTNTGVIVERTDTGTKAELAVGSGGINHGIWSYLLNQWLIYGDANHGYLMGGKTKIDGSTGQITNSGGYTDTDIIKDSSGNQIKNLKNGYFITISGAGWRYIGDFAFKSQGNYAVIDCFFGTGTNGNPYQNASAQILLKQGWSGENLPIGVTTTYSLGYFSDYKVKISHIDKQSCKLYMYLPWTYSDFTYSVSGSYGRFTPSNSTLSSEPTTDKESAYYTNSAQRILYSNSSGTTGTITLSDSLGNYDKAKIYYFDADNRKDSIEVTYASNSNVYLTNIQPGSSQLYISGAPIVLNGSTITFSANRRYSAWNSVASGSYIKIYRVEGIR